MVYSQHPCEASSTESRFIYRCRSVQGGHELIGTFCRLRDVQGQTTEVWRREAWVPTMREAQGRVRRLPERLQMATLRGDERQIEH